METDFFDIDMGSSPYFNPQEQGDGQFSLGDAQGADWMDWGVLPEDLRSMFLVSNDNASQVGGSPAYSLDQNSLQNYLTSTGSSLKESQRPGGYKNTGTWARGLFDKNNNVVGGLSYGNNGAWQDELGFNLTAMFLGPGGIATGGAAGGLGASATNNAAGATAINAGTAGALNAAGSGAEDRDIFKAGATGALGSYTPGVGEYLGIEDQYLRSAVDNSARAAAVASVNGNDVGTAVGQAAIPSLAQYLGGQMNFDTLDDLPGTLGGTMQDEYGESSATLGGYASPAQQQATQQLPQNQKQRASTTEGSGFQLPELGAFFNKLIPSSPEQFGDLAQGLMGLYSGYRQRRAAKDLRNQIGGNRGAYEQQLIKSLQRRDAASGRRSNYGGRAVELQAALANLDSRNAPALQAADTANLGGLINMFQSGLRYAGKQGAFGDKYNPNVSTAPMTTTLLPSTWAQQPAADYSLGNSLQLGDQNKRRIFGGS